MIQGSVEIITGVAAVLIGVIISVYFFMLRRNGWLGEGANYRCPNPECKTIFHAPIKVKDFSSKKEVGFACPECGCDLGSSKNLVDLKEIAPQSEPELKIQESTPHLIGAGALDSKVDCNIEEVEVAKASSLIVESQKDESPSRGLGIFSREKSESSKTCGSEGCRHYFGYLGDSQSRSETLDECLLCPRLIECSEKEIIRS